MFAVRFPVTCLPVLLGVLLGTTTAADAQEERTLPESVEKLSLDRSVFPEPEELTGVRRGIDPGETASYYRVLSIANDVDPQQLRQAALDFRRYRRSVDPVLSRLEPGRFPPFVDLANNLDLYRGRPVTLTGRVRKWSQYPATKNNEGIETLYELWLYTEDSQTLPTVVIATDLPDDFPSSKIAEGVSVTGYLFKKYGYASRDRKLRFAPMVLAGSIRYSPPEVVPVEIPTWAVILVCVALTAVVVVGWQTATPKRLPIRNRTPEEDRFELPPEWAFSSEDTPSNDRSPDDPHSA